jgi:hypothetical protein
MLEEVNPLITNEEQSTNTGFWHSVRNYIKQPKIIDWIIVGIIIVAVIATIILCV